MYIFALTGMLWFETIKALTGRNMQFMESMYDFI
jgi:hypothetical protein